MMVRVHPEIEAILAERGLVTTVEHPRLKSSLFRLTRRGVLDNPLPGVFVPATETSPNAWLRAVSAWAGPVGVIHGRSAAGLWLPELAGPVAFLAHPSLRDRRGVRVSRHLVPRDFVLTPPGLRVASPCYAAVELAATDDGRALCEALRRRLADSATIAAALTSFAATPGHLRRTKVVAACAGNPWSYAELRLHRILRAGGVTGWIANAPVFLAGVTVIPDVRFRAKRLVLEFDGRDSHHAAAQFLADRERANLLEAAGFHILRFGWEHLDQPEYILTTVRQGFRAAPPTT